MRPSATSRRGERRFRPRIDFTIIACFLGVLTIAVSAGSSAPSAATDVNPNATPAAPYGGRVNALTIDPVNSQIAYAGGELSGVWRTTDGGLDWSHVDAIPLTVVRDVEIAPSDSNLIIATGDYDGRVTSQAGIWRSTDGGATWSKPATGDPSCTTEPSSHGIAIAPGSPGSLNVWVADSCGLAHSSDSGATWTHFSPNGLPGQLWDVEVRPRGGSLQIDVCGDNGYARSTTGGATAGSFAAGTNPIPAGGFGPCTVATAPQDPDTVYTTHYSGVNASGFCIPQFQQSTDGGTNWVDMGISDANCRDPWVVTHPALDGDPTHYEVYEGTGVLIRHQHCDASLAGKCAAGVGNWADITDGSHSDTSDIAFDTSVPNGCPRLLSSDGGVFRTTVAPASCVGTQDNGIYYTGDGGATYTRTGPDVYSVYADHNPPARVLWRHCFGCGVDIANPGLAGSGGFSLPPGDDVPNNFVATQFGPQSYAFVTRDGPAPNNSWKVEVTTNEGGSWSQMGPDPLPGSVGNTYQSFTPQILASGPPASPTFYLRLNVGGNKIYRLSGPFNAGATLTQVSSGLNFVTDYAVDPDNPNLLYAYDVSGATGRIMRSTNGGASWSPDTAALTLLRRSNQFKTTSGIGPLVNSIEFDGNSDAIMIGSQTAGIIASVNNGASWFNVRGAEQLPRISGFFFDERTGSIYTSTQGRGLWRLDIPVSDLSVTKSDSPDPVIAGNELYYTITVHNDGPDTASAITVTDTLPSDVSFVTSTIPCTNNLGTLTCAIPDIDSGDSFTFTVKVAVHPNALIGSGSPKTIFNNVSVASGETIDSDLSNNADTESTIVEDSADLEVTKLCKPDTNPAAGQPIDCTVFVDNHGPSSARSVVVTDRLLSDGAFTISNIAPSQGSCGGPLPVTGGQQFTCNLGALDPASTTSTGRATITYRVSANDGQDINNLATVRSDTPDPDSSNNSATLSLTVHSVADLGLTKSGPASVVAGTPISWTLDVTNAGPSSAQNVIVTDNVPAGVTITSVTAPGGACVAGVAGDPFQPTTCTFASFASGGPTKTVTINAMVGSGTDGPLHNDASVSSDTFDPNNANNLAHSDTTVTKSADLALTYTSDSPIYKPSSTIHYKVTVANNGPSDAAGVVVTVELPSPKVGYYVSDSGGCALTNATLSCPLGTFVAGSPTRTIFVDFFVQGSKGTVTSTASVASPTPDPNLANNSATVNVTKK